MTMRQRANWSLSLLALTFIVIIIARFYIEPVWWLDALLFIVEAGMVGALADWFAVSALFRHPLGLSWIPHTAIIPKKKQQLIDGVVALVEEQLLDRELIENKLRNVSVSSTIIDYLGPSPINKLNERSIKGLIVNLATRIITSQSISKVEALLEKLIYKASLAKWLAQALTLMKQRNLDDKLINKLIELLQERLSRKDVLEKIKSMLNSATTDMTEASFFKRLMFRAAEAINAVNLDDAAHIIYEDILLLVNGIRDKEHPARVLIDEHLTKLVDSLEQKDDMNVVLQVWLANFLREFQLQSWLPNWLKQFFVVTDDQDFTKTVDFIGRLIKKWANAVWQWFRENKAAQLKVDGYINNFITYLLQNEYKIVGEVVRETLSNFTDARLVQFIESKVEIDLQRIRLNGTLIGAIIGGLLYLFLYVIYTPFLNLF